MEKAVCECRRSFSVPAGFQGDAVPPGYVSGFSGTGNDTPLSSAQRTRPRRRKVNCPEGAREGALGYGAGRGKKVRYTPRLSWGILRGALRCACPSSLPAARLDGNSARSAQKSTPLACFSFSCRIPTKSEQAGQACRSRPRKILRKSRGVYLTFTPLPAPERRGLVRCADERGLSSPVS